MTLRNYIIIAALGSVLAVRAQEEPAAPVFRPPFDFPLILSGNFGELRSNHFHGGVDFKTQGEVGKPIHCIADGYVSRVLVTPGGYGQAIFITHPNGYTSVYGHVLKFASAVAKVVEEYQYRHETFAVDLKFEPHQVSFKAGEIIALSGNEGYSFGPHLHMEIRRTDTGELIDPLQFYTDKIKDTTPPRASMIMLYPQRGAGVVEGSQRKKSISVASLGQPVSAWGKIAAGIKAYDYMDGGCLKIELRWPLLFHLQLKSFGFFSKKEFINLLLKVSSFQTFFFVAISPLRGYFCKIMCNGQQAELNFNLLKPTKMEPLEVLVVLEVSKYGFHILRSLAAIFQAFIREQFFTFPFLDFPQTMVYLHNSFRPASVTPAS